MLKPLKQYFIFLKSSIILIQKNWIASIVNKFVILLFFLSITLIIWKWNRFPPQIPLLYSKIWGENRLASPIWLFILPLGSLFWHFITMLISLYEPGKYLVFAQILFLSSFIVSAMSFLILIKISILIL